MIDPRHSFSDQGCVLCGYKCDHTRYSKRYLRFVRAHQEAFEAAYLDGNAQAARNELERLSREYRTLPPRHDCSCPRRNARTGITEYHCLECRRIGESIPRQDVAVEIGRTRAVHAPAPMTLMLDIGSGYAG